MLFGNKRLYEQTRKMKLGKRKLPHPLDELRRWVNEKYSINVLNVVFDRIDIGPAEGRPRLNLIVDTADDYLRMHKDSFTPKSNYKKSILKKFSDIIEESGLGEEYDTRDVHLIFNDFSDEAMRQASTQLLENDKEAIISKFAQFNIWDIFGFSKSIVVFYLMEKDLKENEGNGSNDLIKQECYQVVKRYDEFDCFQLDSFPITFDSKENLDNNYEGSLFYYFR